MSASMSRGFQIERTERVMLDSCIRFLVHSHPAIEQPLLMYLSLTSSPCFVIARNETECVALHCVLANISDIRIYTTPLYISNTDFRVRRYPMHDCISKRITRHCETHGKQRLLKAQLNLYNLIHLPHQGLTRESKTITGWKQTEEK